MCRTIPIVVRTATPCLFPLTRCEPDAANRVGTISDPPGRGEFDRVDGSNKLETVVRAEVPDETMATGLDFFVTTSLTSNLVWLV